MNRTASLVLGLAVLVGGCDKKAPDPAPIAATPLAEAVSAKPVASGKKRFAVQTEGKATFLIDAPLEKIKGEASKLSGVLDVNLDDLKASTGEVIVDLDSLATKTFEGDADKNKTQTEHAHNWLEIGPDVEAKTRDDHKLVRFTIESTEASVKSLADVKEESGARKVTFTATGTFRLHGRSARKTTTVVVSFTGPPTSPTAIAFETSQPVVASLAEHDVKPRDPAGKFLNGALEKVGKKIDDKVHCASRAAPYLRADPRQASIRLRSSAHATNGTRTIPGDPPANVLLPLEAPPSAS
ncbi:MAG: hypothetical protein ACHREM_22050 [Polyangiales bacterium]